MLGLQSAICWSASLLNIALNVAFKMFDFDLSSVHIIPFAALNGETPTASCLLLLINCQNIFGFTFKSGVTLLHYMHSCKLFSVAFAMQCMNRTRNESCPK